MALGLIFVKCFFQKVSQLFVAAWTFIESQSGQIPPARRYISRLIASTRIGKFMFKLLSITWNWMTPSQFMMLSRHGLKGLTLKILQFASCRQEGTAERVLIPSRQLIGWLTKEHHPMGWREPLKCGNGGLEQNVRTLLFPRYNVKMSLWWQKMFNDCVLCK